MASAALIYPHQLYEHHPALEGVSRAVLVEEPLLFTQYPFARQKLLYHRATMRRWADTLKDKGLSVTTIEAARLPDTAALAEILARQRIREVQYVDPCDDWLSTGLSRGLKRCGIRARVLEDPHFLTPISSIKEYTEGRKKLYFTDFYISQRKRLGILLQGDDQPVGGKWSFDTQNRRRLPKNQRVPMLPQVAEDHYVREAREYVRRNFSSAPGSDEYVGYPIDHAGAARWLEDFIAHRLPLFGDYEDALSTTCATLYHSLLTPMLNTGLLSPRQVIEAALARAEKIPINSLEGFIRQVIGWREFMRLVYLTHGRQQRTSNFWGLTRPMPRAFYDGSTSIEPVDTVIRKVLRIGYAHHIERLMILGNFMLLCDIHPDAVYQWFMELFIDAYDWVMVPNVYGMSQHADGGLMTTKPYISGSSYVLKMSDYAPGPWCKVWDALYWRFIDAHAQTLAANPRMTMMVRMKEKLGDRMQDHRKTAEEFLARLHG